MTLPSEETDNPTDTPVRSSSSERILTKEGKETHNHDIKKCEKTFNKAYDSWKQVAKETRTKLKTIYSVEDLDKLNLLFKLYSNKA